MSVGLFSGPALAVADGKGRFAIPVTLRRVLKDDGSDNIVYISYSNIFGCGVGFCPSYMQQLDQIGREEDAGTRPRPEGSNALHQWQEKFGLAEATVFDDGGRFSLSPYIRSLTGIDDMIFFSGAGRYFEMWNPQRLLANDNVYPPLKAAAEYFLQEWAANPKNPKNGGGK